MLDCRLRALVGISVAAWLAGCSGTDATPQGNGGNAGGAAGTTLGSGGRSGAEGGNAGGNAGGAAGTTLSSGGRSGAEGGKAGGAAGAASGGTSGGFAGASGHPGTAGAMGGAGGAGAAGAGVAGAGGEHRDAGSSVVDEGSIDGMPHAVVVSPVPNGKQIIVFNGTPSPPPEATRMPGVPRGTLDTFTFDTSKVFPGTSREVDIFIPAQYVGGTEVPFIVIQDGVEQLTSYHTNIVLENLIYEKRLPIMAAVFVNRPDNGPERSREYDCLDDAYSQFIDTEILPVVTQRHPDLNLTSNPDGRGSLGKSSGGPAAFTLGWRHPDQYRRITTFNGSFVHLCALSGQPGADSYPGLIRMTDPAKPLRVYLFSGSNDNAGFAAGNQAMADALQSKGYAWRYVYGQNASHDNAYAASMIVEGLLWTWAGYPL
jgi:iron(III)-enterobactin esterase